VSQPSTWIVGVIGAGTMGAGIAQVALEAGHEVVLHDVDEGAIDAARGRVRDGLGRRAAKLELDADSIDDWVEGRLSRLRGSLLLDAVAGEADLVVEAAIEDLAAKQAIFRVLGAVARPETILTTNTSALSVTAIGAAADRPERVAGLHFFNPVPLMSLVEVVATPVTASAVIEAVERMLRAWGKTPVRCLDRPGFIVNRVNRPYTLEALRSLEAGEASVEAIDGALRGAGFPLGPFELMDLTGIDVTLATTRSIWSGLGEPDRLRPSPIQERLVADGRLGRKTGAGFYRYEGGRRTTVEPEFQAGSTPTDLGADAIVARLLDAIDTEARIALAEGIAGESTIDLALRLGAGHPEGPFERGARLQSGA
jgi:3-hydroxybutyryl-CoA dehydrogenase